MPSRLIITSDAQLRWIDEGISSTQEMQGDRKGLPYISPSLQGVGETLAVSLLSPDTALQAWHQLLIAVSGSVFTVQFDGIHVIEGILAHTFQSFALLTERCSAAFTGISLTDHFRDEFLNAAHTPTLLGWQTEMHGSTSAKDDVEDWHVQDGALEQINASIGTHILLKGSLYESCEFGATMKLKVAGEHESAALGLVLWRSEADKRFLWLTQDASNASTLVVESLGTLASKTLTHKLSQRFSLHDWHTLRLVYQGDSLTLYLDGPELLTLALPSNVYKMGLATRNTGAAFTGVWQTGY